VAQGEPGSAASRVPYLEVAGCRAVLLAEVEQLAPGEAHQQAACHPLVVHVALAHPPATWGEMRADAPTHTG